MGAVAPAAFADASKTVGLLAAPQPGSVAPELFHGEKSIPGPWPKAFSRGTDVVVDTSRRKEILVHSGRQKVSHEKNSRAMQDEPTGNEILADSSGRQKFPHKKSRQEFPVDPSGRQNFPRGKNRQEIPVDTPDRHFFFLSREKQTRDPS